MRTLDANTKTRSAARAMPMANVRGAQAGTAGDGVIG